MTGIENHLWRKALRTYACLFFWKEGGRKNEYKWLGESWSLTLPDKVKEKKKQREISEKILKIFNFIPRRKNRRSGNNCPPPHCPLLVLAEPGWKLQAKLSVVHLIPRVSDCNCRVQGQVKPQKTARSRTRNIQALSVRVIIRGERERSPLTSLSLLVFCNFYFITKE